MSAKNKKWLYNHQRSVTEEWKKVCLVWWITVDTGNADDMRQNLVESASLTKLQKTLIFHFPPVVSSHVFKS